jgi:hypothetical protein
VPLAGEIAVPAGVAAPSAVGVAALGVTSGPAQPATSAATIASVAASRDARREVRLAMTGDTPVPVTADVTAGGVGGG